MAFRNTVRHGHLYSKLFLKFSAHLHICCKLIQLGTNFDWGSVCILHTIDESQRVIRTWQKKWVGAPSLTAASKRLSIADSSPGRDWERGTKHHWHQIILNQWHWIPRNRFPHDCRFLGTLFNGQSSYKATIPGDYRRKQWCRVHCAAHFWPAPLMSNQKRGGWSCCKRLSTPWCPRVCKIWSKSLHCFCTASLRTNRPKVSCTLQYR